MNIAKLIIPLAAIAAITFLEYTAISHGINGATLAAAVAVISGLGGYEAKTIAQIFKTKISPK